MLYKFYFRFQLVVLLLCGCGVALAAEPWERAEDARALAENRKKERVRLAAQREKDNRDRVAFQMGFLVGHRNYVGAIFARDGGSDDRGSAYQSIYQRPPFQQVLSTGLHWSFLLRMSHIRMSLGFGLPFSLLRPEDTRFIHEVNGEKKLVRIQSLQPYEFRFGLGGEYTWGRITPFVDVVGAIHLVKTQMSVDERSLDYSSTHFSFSARGGVRIKLRPYFFMALYGEVGFVGSMVWSGGLAVGFRTP